MADAPVGSPKDESVQPSSDDYKTPQALCPHRCRCCRACRRRSSRRGALCKKLRSTSRWEGGPGGHTQTIAHSILNGVEIRGWLLGLIDPGGAYMRADA